MLDAERKAELWYVFWLKLLELVLDKLILGGIVGIALWIGSGILTTYNAVLAKNVDDHKKVLTDGSNDRLAAFQAKLTTQLDENRTQLSEQSGKNLEAFKLQLTQSLEEHRHRLAMQQYFAQKRFEAIDGVIMSYNRLFELFVANTRKKAIDDDARKEYRLAIQAVFQAHSNKELVIPRDFSMQLEKLGFLHRGLFVNGFSDKKYMNLFVDLGDQFSQMGRDAVDPPAPGKETKYFKLAALPSAEDRKSNVVAGKYLDAELERWEQWKKNQP